MTVVNTEDDLILELCKIDEGITLRVVDDLCLHETITRSFPKRNVVRDTVSSYICMTESIERYGRVKEQPSLIIVRNARLAFTDLENEKYGKHSYIVYTKNELNR